MKLHTAVFSRNGGISLNCSGKGFLGGTLDALIGAVNALLGVYIVFICQISGKISRLEIQSFRKIIRFYGFHQIVRHLG